MDGYKLICEALLLEKPYSDARNKRTKKVHMKYRLKFVETVASNKQTKSAGHRAGFHIRLMKLYKKYDGKLPEFEKNKLRRDYGFKIPSPRGFKDYANRQYQGYSRAERWAREEAARASSRREQSSANAKAWRKYQEKMRESRKRARKFKMIYYAVVLAVSIVVIIMDRQEEEREREKKAKARKRAAARKKKSKKQ